MLIGEFHHNIDSKGRITIPSKVREELGEEFVITRGLDGCLSIYSLDVWNKLVYKYKELPDTKNKRQFLRIFLSGALNCIYDNLGRINISNPLIEYAKLEKECIIIGVGDHLEIWSKNNWKEFMQNNEENLSLLADNFIGDINE